MAKAADYIEDVQRYDPAATEAHVQKIVNYCGIALQNRDSSLVSCSDETEKNRVRDGFCKKKLGMEQDEAGAAVDAVCATMKEDRNKQRVTFLYILSKNAGKLGDL
ncbi:uncharacterized protein DUF2853 [Litorimonas taeanensis]|uniref:Uncharacterized protein DUF2853 n=1 Tax=Litorimonas taeanensis TaxID=568099 RepID=A0A420WKZ3_9PROT|nr:DUF2853 family protein [Litorimonas taeanensis]RKQ71684.1 uncharacterized protein DUF2853 [Litorimonas taeanensis]